MNDQTSAKNLYLLQTGQVKDEIIAWITLLPMLLLISCLVAINLFIIFSLFYNSNLSFSELIGNFFRHFKLVSIFKIFFVFFLCVSLFISAPPQWANAITDCRDKRVKPFNGHLSAIHSNMVFGTRVAVYDKLSHSFLYLQGIPDTVIAQINGQEGYPVSGYFHRQPHFPFNLLPSAIRPDYALAFTMNHQELYRCEQAKVAADDPNIRPRLNWYFRLAFTFLVIVNLCSVMYHAVRGGKHGRNYRRKTRIQEIKEKHNIRD